MASTVFLLSNCSKEAPRQRGEILSSSAVSVSRAACVPGIKAYEKSVHALLRRDCLPCHDKGGIGPPHGVADIESSYALAISYVNWGNLLNSKLIKKGGNRHCRDYPEPTNSPGNKCVSTEADLAKELQSWWEDGQKDCPNFGNYVTVPTGVICNEVAWTPVEWNLKKANPDLSGVRLEMEARAGDKAITIRKPRLVGLTYPVRIEKMYVVANAELIQSPFSAVKAIAMPEGDPESPVSAVLSGSEFTFAVENLENFRLSIGFDVLEKSEGVGCKEKDLFKANVLPEIEKRKTCYRCHGGPDADGTSDARARLDMKVGNDALCESLLARGNGKFVNDSPLISYPLRGANGHLIAVPVASEVLPLWTDWLLAERKHFPKWREEK